ncbi:hypothetical protein B0T25DRAFT_620109 [Lasiosphaeria hispida]|uniref:Phosphoribosylaminoimidazole-succinocarboxamide synthase n=1 Tax=Lasiosphaeria hispida TaxID=260671 RepID=A0AAJ0MK53_9PEZI|nr:hypothetical protein B0T25DRAFT_620109 [Lasiosphaeria hispida]
MQFLDFPGFSDDFEHHHRPGGLAYAASRPTSPSPHPTVVPFYAPTPPSIPLRSPSPTSSEPELYGPDRLSGAPQIVRAYSRPIIVEGPLRRVPDLPVSPQYQQPEWEATFNAPMATDFRDELARMEGVITPGVDDTPYVQYAIEALTRNRDRDTGYSNDGASSSDGATPVPPFIPGQQPEYYQPYPPAPQHHQYQPQAPAPVPVLVPIPGLAPALVPVPAHQYGLFPSQPPPAQLPREPTYHDPQLILGLEPPTRPMDPRASADSLASSLKNGQRLVQANEWRPVDREFIVSTIGEAKASSVPALNFKPVALRTPSLMVLMALCLHMIGALIFSAVYSELHHGLLPYASIYGGQYFLFRIIPPVLGAVVLFYAQFVIITMFRILPFTRLSSDQRDEREGAIFQELYPKSFLWPQLIGTWHIWVPILVTWLINFTIPLQNSLFTVILVDGEWTWGAVQGVAWALVALYLALFVSTAIVWRYWARMEKTGLLWDPRSIADVVATVSDTNTADDYHGTQLARTKDGIKFALRRRVGDRLGYWTWKDGRQGFWYALGNSMDDPNALPLARDQLTGKRMERSDEKQAEKQGMSPDSGATAGDHDVEGSGRSVQGRYRYLPWCMRNNQLLYFIVTAFVLLLAIFIVSFLPSTRITEGFLPWLSAAPGPGAFSAADFLYSFLPSLLGMIMFLLFQSLELSVRILQPWAALSDPRGARAEHSLLADYAACAPFQSSLHALRSGHLRVAALSLLSTLFILIPILAGATFMALTPPSGIVRMYPNIPAFAVVLTLLALYLFALIGLLPGRQAFRLPHAVTCLAEIIGFIANDDLINDLAFKQCRGRDEMLTKMGLDKGLPDSQPRWLFGVATEAGGDEALGVRRTRRFTEKRKVRKSQIRRGGGSSSGRVMVV